MAEGEEEKPFAVERAKTGRAKCKKCKCPIDKDAIRIAKLVANPFGEGKIKTWHHVSCLFEVFARQRATTKRIDDPEEDVSGWEILSDEDKQTILRKIEELEKSAPQKSPKGGKGAATNESKKRKVTPNKEPESASVKRPRSIDQNDLSSPGTSSEKKSKEPIKKFTKDDTFLEFQKLCDRLASVDAYTEKTALVKKLLTNGSNGDGFKSDVKLWCRLLLPGVSKRIYNLQSKQLIKLFSRILLQDEDEMLEHLEQGDVAETIRVFFEKSVSIKPKRDSIFTVQEVDNFLEKLSQLTKEDDQVHHFRSIISRCTLEDLKMIIRLIKHDLRINAGPKHILGAIHEHAYEAFQTSRDLNTVIDRCLKDTVKVGSFSSISSSSSDGTVALSLMTPVLPMLAEACKSVEMAMKKCPRGMLAEVKYDGERVQVHKRGNEFRYFSRSLKPVLPHKVNLFKDYIPKAFPDGDDLILDSEVLMIDTRTGQPLPFGSLGIHKKAEFKDANVCLYVFDCIYYNGEVLLHKSMTERRRILTERMTAIPNRIMLSEVKKVQNPQDLTQMIAKVLKLGLEGLVLKDVHSKYEPGKRHWLKVKKDYLFDGAMADSADLVVLGAWYGTGNKGGMMSVFLMGCYDEDRDLWLTVTKVHTGHDDATLAMLQGQLDMVKIGKDLDKVPPWLRANKPMVPDFVAKDPKKQPVWEITGAEFTNQGVHTADGISIRFPRVTRIREDKDWATATTLKELRRLFEQRSDSIDLSLLLPSTSKETGKLPTINKKIKEEPLSESDTEISLKKYDSSSKSKIEIDGNMKNEVKKSTFLENVDVKMEMDEKIKKELFEDDGNFVNEEEKAKYYAFVDKAYIEYTKNGSPLNWIEGRKPPNGLPSNAKPLFDLTDNELRSNTVLKGVPVSLTPGFKKSQGRRVRELVKTLGGKLVKDYDKSMAAYVLHPDKEILSTTIHEFQDISRSARHVNVSWLDACASSLEMEQVEMYAVELAPDYCSCPCKHQL